MNIFVRRITLLFLVVGMLASCNSFRSTPTITPTPTQTVTPAPSAAFNYTIQRGDSLDSLAERFNLGPDGALLIYNANREVMEANGGIIFVGQTIKIPAPGSILPTFTPIPSNLPPGTLIEYSVLPGDTLAGIAARFNSLEEAIIAENKIENANALQVGQVLQIPVNLVTPTAAEIPTPTPIPTHTPLPELLPDAIDLQWITAYGLPSNQNVTKIHPTKDGGFILVGNTVLLKLRVDGYIEWQKSLRPVTALDVLETSAGDFILAGDLHWIKLDSQGNLLWQYKFELPSYHTGSIIRLVEESDGNIVVEAVGSRAVFTADGELQSFTEYTMQWDSRTYPESVRDRSEETLWAGGIEPMWVGKADLNNGWLKVFSFPEYPIWDTLFIQTTADGGALVGNPIYSYVVDATFDLVISRFSGDGSVRWQKVYHAYLAASHEDFHAFETKSGDFIVAGTLGYYLNDGVRNDVWMLRLDRGGNIRWSKLYGEEGQDAVAVIDELSNGDLIFAGHTNGAGTGGEDLWVLKTNAQGEIPNCGLALDIPAGRTSAISPEVETIALEGISVSERETILIFEDEQRAFSDADAQAIPLCAARPSP
jgi:LysM repeat protein